MPLTARRALVVTLLLIGALIRLAALPLPGTSDVRVWKIWSHAAVTKGVTRMYGVGGHPPERRLLTYDGEKTTVDYPPLALYELALVGLLYRALSPTYPNTPALTAAVKLPVVLADGATAWLLFWWARRLFGDTQARWALWAYWLNPAIVLNGAVLGYLDPLCALPALAALLTAARSPLLAGSLLAAAVLTKAQPVLLTPAIGLALWHAGPRGPRGLARAAGAAGLTAGLLVLPIVLAGAWSNMLQALHSLTGHDMLSGQAANLWWVVTYGIRVWDGVSYLKLDWWEALTSPVRILPLSTLVDVLKWPDPRPVAVTLVAASAAWSVWRARRAADVCQQAALGAFLVDAYFVLAVQVHENHQFLVVPLLLVAATGRPAYRPLFWLLSGLSALNLNFFYGLGEEVGYGVPRSLTVIDGTVLLAAVNLVALGTFARRLAREAMKAPPGAPAPPRS